MQQKFIEDMTTEELQEEVRSIKEYLKDIRERPALEVYGQDDQAADQLEAIEAELVRRDLNAYEGNDTREAIEAAIKWAMARQDSMTYHQDHSNYDDIVAKATLRVLKAVEK